MPWRQTKDPYPVWLSEIILQQTRVEQGMPYWKKFMETFPTVHDLANAQEEKVLRLWQGLGYYSRARYLHATAKYISKTLGGSFPSSYEGLIKLKGIGPYTAAAIASICFNEPRPVVDGNVFRFASRFFGIKTDIVSSGARKEFEGILEKHIARDIPGTFNQGMMEFGATVCAPFPKCEACVFNLDCFAKKNSMQKELPVKSKKVKTRERFFNYLVFRDADHFLLNERTGKDVWSGLYDFYLIESNQDHEFILMEAKKLLESTFEVVAISGPVTHILSHQKIMAKFFEIKLEKKHTKRLFQNSSLGEYSIEEVLNLPKPKLIVNYLNQLGIH